ncbi:cytochrome P450 [Tropicibacter sp. S64]|uniref:cytochrome P450 n=1 Tax=Tropicibacter sp. S64 TaxID=3415122 RepID=UPI003C7B7DE1
MSPESFSTTPIEADMAQAPVGLLRFVRNAGRSLLSVIPSETLHALYVKGPARIHYLCDPDLITRVLVTDAANFPKSRVTKNILGSAIGNGMILSEGKVWKEQRRRYAPLFAARNLPVLARTFADTGDRLGRDLASTAGTVDVSTLAQNASLSDITQVMFSGSQDVDPAEVKAGLARYTAYVAEMSLFDLMGLPSWVPRLKWLKSKAPVTDMRRLARTVILARQGENREEPQDFLDLMIDAVKADTEELDQTVDNLLTFVVAGHETAANTLSWGVYLLALYPEAQEALRTEILAACPEGPIPYAALEAMPRLDAHVKETLRLYPAAAFFARDVAQDVTLGDIPLRKGDALFLPIYALHRNALLWDAPNSYRPDRFDGAKLARGQYLPFGDGPRVCIGAQYATTEIKILLASVLRCVRFSLSHRPIPKPLVTITMHPEGPLHLRAAPL